MKIKFKLLRIIFLLILVTSCEKATDKDIDNELTNDVLEKPYNDVTTQKRQPAASEVIKNNSKKSLCSLYALVFKS
jgi:hypothetical protein